jgi:hypothetical protein
MSSSTRLLNTSTQKARAFCPGLTKGPVVEAGHHPATADFIQTMYFSETEQFAIDTGFARLLTSFGP